MIPVKKVWTGTGPKNFGMKIVAPSLLRKDWIYENASFDFGLIIELKMKKFKIGKDRVPKLRDPDKSLLLTQYRRKTLAPTPTPKRKMRFSPNRSIILNKAQFQYFRTL